MPEVFSRRERQIMDIVYRLGRATAAEVLAELPDPPSYSAARAALRVLEEKGHLRHVREGVRYVYEPATEREKASQSAARRLLETFFDNSAERAVAALIDVSREQLTEEDFDRLARLIEKAKEEGR
jgi:predicted transcriptional regulator